MNMLLLTGIVGALALGYAAVASGKIGAFKVDHARVNELSGIIQGGAMAFLYREYKALVPFVIVVGALLAWKINPQSAVCFVCGAVCSALTGYVGMRVATKSNGKTAFAATHGMNDALKIAFTGGSVMGMTVVGVGLLGVVVMYFIFNDANIVTAFGFGASSIALFARVGGGIYTKAADVGADLVGKVEAGIPEDDPRNPAVIADNVGDNVGDIAGMGADLFESYVNSIIAAMAIGALVMDQGGVIYPLLLSAIGIIASILGTFFVRVKEGGDPAKALRIGLGSTGLFMIIGAYFLTNWMFGDLTLFFAVISGVICGLLIGAATEYYTSGDYGSVKEIAAASETGAATNILAGLGVGMKSTAIPVILVCIATLAGYQFGGLYGIACSAVGMLAITGMALSVDAYGPIADNAGGIAEMTHMPAEVRQRTDALDSLGNTTAATGKGFAIGSAALTALALIASYIDKVHQIKPDMALDLTITNPTTLIGLFIGGMLPFLFAALTMDAVGKAAQSIVVEVRRQFSAITGLMEGKAEPDYARCVDMCTRSAQKLMLAPALIAVIVPVVVGLILGVNGVAGLLAGTTVTGFVLAVMMANSGGAWDNAKKYIESGQHGGKGSDCHKAAVVGDTVGDPFKDTSGPAINILIKLTSMVSIVFAGLIVAVHLL